MSIAPHRTILLTVSALAFMTACTSTGSQTAPPPPVIPAAGDLLVETITVRGHLAQTGAVTVRAVADQDGAVDRDFRVAFHLDGGTSTTSLPRDPGLTSGQTWTATLPIISTTAGGVVSADLIITLAP